MYPISQAVAALFEAEQRQILRITGTDKNGAAIYITDADVLINGFNIDRFSCTGEKLEVGTACAAGMELKLYNGDGKFNNIIFEGAELFVEIGVADWSLETPVISYIPCGYFTSDEQPRRMATISIKAMDRMARFDAIPPTLTPWTDNFGNPITDNNGDILYFSAKLVLPCTIADLVQQICIRCQVPFNQDLSGFPNYDYILTAMPAIKQEITFRNLIQWCAGIMGTCAFIDWTGHLVFKWYTAASYTSTMAKRFSSDLQENDITITGVKYTNTQNVTIVSGTDAYALDMTGNYLAASGIAQILPAVKNALNGFTYRPFTASSIPAPWLWPLDVITFTDKDGVDHSCIVTNVNFGLNGVTELQGKGQTEQINKSATPNAMTPEQAFMLEQAIEAYDETLDQDNIFNKLTDNGQAQGIYIINGQLYINMSYARSGKLVLGGLNDQNGELEVRDANNNVVGTIDNAGMRMLSGSIVLSHTNDNKTNRIIIDPTDNYPFVNAYYVNDSLVSSVQIKDGEFAITNPPNDGTHNTVMNGEGIQISDNRDFDQPEIYMWNTYRNHITRLSTEALNIYDRAGTYLLEVSKDGLWSRYDVAGDNSVPRVQLYNAGTGLYTRVTSEYFRMYKPDTNEYLIAAYNGGNSYLKLWGELGVYGTKNRIVETDQYSERLLYCYETPSPMFGDIGEGVISDDGLCYVTLDAVFAQTVTTSQYQVFLQKYGDGDCWVKARNSAYFIVQGTPGLAFGWEIKAKQRDFDQLRLEKSDSKFAPPMQTYGQDAAEYIKNLEDGRIPA